MTEHTTKWRRIEDSPPKTDSKTMIAVQILGWIPDETTPDGGDVEVIWWEPRLRGGCWYCSADRPVKPTLWRPMVDLPPEDMR